MRRISFIALFSFLLFSAGLSHSHQLSTAYLSLDSLDQGQYEGQLQLRLNDIDKELSLDYDKNGDITWAEVVTNGEAIKALVLSKFSLQSDSDQCTFMIDDQFKLDAHFNDNYLVMDLQSACPAASDLTLAYTGFYDIDSSHKLLLALNSGSEMLSRTLDKTSQSVVLTLDTPARAASFLEFIKQGIIHIAIGYDHILFLLCLLLACVLGTRRKEETSSGNPRVNSEPSFRDSDFAQTLIMVTSFTFAHSITLTLVAMEWISVSSRWVEIAIAASIALAALNNIFPFITRVFYISFGFGLVHGMGFAGVLTELGLPTASKLPAILAFNIGVEIGQVAIICVSFPVLVFLKNYSCYQRQWLVGSSLAIILVSVQWIYERSGF